MVQTIFGTYGQRLLFVFVKKASYASTARPESLLRNIGKKTCQKVDILHPVDRLDIKHDRQEREYLRRLQAGCTVHS